MNCLQIKWSCDWPVLNREAVASNSFTGHFLRMVYNHMVALSFLRRVMALSIPSLPILPLPWALDGHLTFSFHKVANVSYPRAAPSEQMAHGGDQQPVKCSSIACRGDGRGESPRGYLTYVWV